MKDRILSYLRYLVILFVLLVLYLYNNHAITLLFLILAFLLPILSGIGFFLTRTRPQPEVSFHTFFAERGSTVKLRLSVVNPTLYPHTKYKLRFHLSHSMGETEYLHEVTFHLLPRKRQEQVLTLSFDYCGVYRAELTEAETSGLFDLAGTKKKLSQTAEVVVLPSSVELNDSFHDTKYFADNADEVSDESGKGDDRSEIFEIRDYHPGDELQTVHWKLSAKADNLMVKVFSEPLGEQFSVFLELNYTNVKEMDAYYDLAFTVISYFQQAKYRFSVTYAGSKGDLYQVPIEKEEDVLQLIMKLLYDVRKSSENDEREATPPSVIGRSGYLITCMLHSRFEGTEMILNHKNIARVYRISR